MTGVRKAHSPALDDIIQSRIWPDCIACSRHYTSGSIGVPWAEAKRKRISPHPNGEDQHENKGSVLISVPTRAFGCSRMGREAQGHSLRQVFALVQMSVTRQP